MTNVSSGTSAPLDFEALMSVELRHTDLEYSGGLPYGVIALRLAEQSSDELKSSHPLQFLRVARRLSAAGLEAQCDALLNRMEVLIPRLPLPEAERRQLLGELKLTAATQLIRLRDLKNLRAACEEARGLLHQPSRVTLPTESFAYGSNNMFSLFYQIPGSADSTAAELSEAVAFYGSLTGGAGSGVDILYRAELAYGRGDMQNAEELAYKAYYIADRGQLDILSLNAAELPRPHRALLRQPRRLRRGLRQARQARRPALSRRQPRPLGGRADPLRAPQQLRVLRADAPLDQRAASLPVRRRPFAA